MSMDITIAHRAVGEGQPVLVVAEIGNNHDGKLSQARRLIRDASEAGCDVVKFQTHIAYEEMIENGTCPPHFKEPRFQFVKRMQFSKAQHRSLKAYAERLGLIFLSSPFSEKAVDLLNELDVAVFKIGSGELTNIPFLQYVAKKKKPIILSTGMSTWQEIDLAVETIRKYNKRLIIMQCTSKYPCPYEEVGLKLIPELKKRYSLPIGLSDHTPTVYTAIAGVALGACLIEKHFTLNKTLYGPDHKASLVKAEMKTLVEAIKAVELALKPFDKDELIKLKGIRDTFQKSLVAKVNIPSGVRITKAMLCQKKPGTGISPVRWFEVVGRLTRKAIAKNRLIEWEHLI